MAGEFRHAYRLNWEGLRQGIAHQED